MTDPMKSVNQIILSIIFSGLLLSACESSKIFVKRKYYASNYELEFFSDNTYLFIDRGHSGYVDETSRGTWKQVGRSIILLSLIGDVSELFVQVRKANSADADIQIVVNLLPRVIYFEYLSKPTDLVSAELVTPEKVYSLNAEINVIRLPKQSGGLFVRAYPRDIKKMECKLSSDTLKSQNISLAEMEGKILLLDVDINPINFAQSARTFDTLRVLNDHKIRWNQIVLSR
jgi:hypothetical protein